LKAVIDKLFSAVMEHLIALEQWLAIRLQIRADNSLVEAFGKLETGRIMSRLDFHFSPPGCRTCRDKCLLAEACPEFVERMIKVELSVLPGQCLSMCIADDWTFRFEIVAWKNARNERKAQIRLKFTTDEACWVF
jgi:hypothetical protein